MMIASRFLLVLSALVFPQAVFAAGLEGVLDMVGTIIGVATPVLVGLALLYFFWGLANFLLHFSGKDEDKKKGREMMTYGLIVLFVIVSIWGLIKILQNTFVLSGTDESSITNSPKVPYLIAPE